MPAPGNYNNENMRVSALREGPDSHIGAQKCHEFGWHAAGLSGSTLDCA
jgi:hypothetical protein